MDSFLQLVLSAFTTLGLSAEVPTVYAEALTDEKWTEKHVLSVLEPESEPLSYIEKNTLLALTDETLYWVVAVLDGDTLLVSGPNRELFQVRLAVDTNEINGPDSTAECYGPEAAFYSGIPPNRAIRLTADPANEDLDPYGRKLRYVDALEEDGSFAASTMPSWKKGHATFPEEYPVTDRAHFENLEKAAQDSGKGLWEFVDTARSAALENCRPALTTANV